MNAFVIHLFSIQVLSIEKLTNSLNCNVIFSSNDVVFKDWTLGKKIGEGIYLHGHYLFKPFSTTSLNSAILENHVVLQQYGHPSNRVSFYVVGEECLWYSSNFKASSSTV